MPSLVLWPVRVGVSPSLVLWSVPLLDVTLTLTLTLVLWPVPLLDVGAGSHAQSADESIL